MQLKKEMEYSHKKMGVNYSKESTTFRVWAPLQKAVTLCIFEEYDDLLRTEYSMQMDENGVYEYTIEGNLDGKFYCYLVDGNLVTDPYSYACSINSLKSAIVDLDSTNPEGFLEHKIPYNDYKKAIILEAHVGDVTVLENSGVKNRGTFLGLTESESNYKGLSTGIGHIKDLGITHLHLMPLTDYLTVDESKPLHSYPNNYNWGYDQELYNCMEGSFSTNPSDPKARIYEFKKMVQTMHENGISVVLDVVYNHTFRTLDSNFNQIMPNYYHRNVNGAFYNGSGCGNEFASEKPMGRKFIIDSLCFLASEYKIDGFRFDLMALIDIDTIMLAKKKLREINPNFMIYGEPWMAQGSLLEYSKQINIGSQKGKDFSIFNPFFRDALKGDNDGGTRGYLQGEYYHKNDVVKGILGSVNYKKLNNSSFHTPLESINYFNAHDNLIFYDKLVKSFVSEDKISDMTVMAFSILMFSQGIPFFHLGNEFNRTKKMNHNSYNSSTEYNGVDWSLKEKNIELFNTVKEIISFRKELGVFNMETAEEVNEKITFISNLPDYIIAFEIKSDKKYLIIHNVSDKFVDLSGIIKLKDIQLIWENKKTNESVKRIVVNKYTTNIYELGE